LAVQRLTSRRSHVETKDITRWVLSPAEWAIFQGGIPADTGVESV
jgi:hypothetical protein